MRGITAVTTVFVVGGGKYWIPLKEVEGCEKVKFINIRFKVAVFFNGNICQNNTFLLLFTLAIYILESFLLGGRTSVHMCKAVERQGQQSL